MNSKEQAIKEKRLIEATKKNFYGATGKLASIAKYLGSPIMRQGTPYCSSTSMAEYTGFGSGGLEEDESETLPTFDEDNETSSCIGYAFDGLSRGMHLEIKYMFDDSVVSVYYRGYPVYMESMGELSCYAPFDEWEKMIEKLSKVAKDKKEVMHSSYLEVERAEVEKEQSNFLDRLRRSWGI